MCSSGMVGEGPDVQETKRNARKREIGKKVVILFTVFITICIYTEQNGPGQDHNLLTPCTSHVGMDQLLGLRARNDDVVVIVPGCNDGNNHTSYYDSGKPNHHPCCPAQP